MDTQFIKSEAEYEDQYYYSLGASSQPQSFMGNSGNGYIEGEEALDTLKFEYGIETSSGNGYIEGEEALDTLKLEYGIETSSGIENIEGKETPDTLNFECGIETRDGEGNNEEDAAEARRLALQKARSLSFGSFTCNNKYKDSANDKLTMHHNHRLRGILAELLSQHRWKESAGVLSVLLKASVKDNYFFRHQYKYWAAMEVLRQLEGFVQQNAITYKRIYLLLKSKQPAPKRAINKRLRPAIQLELALHLMSQGDLFGAREASKSVIQEPQFRDDPVANLLHGLILRHLWYDGVTEGLNIGENSVTTPLEDMEIDISENISISCGPAANSPFASRENSKRQNLRSLDSDSSIGNEKEFSKESGHPFSKKQCSRGTVYNIHEHHVESTVYDTHENDVAGAVYDTGEHHIEGVVYDNCEHHVQGSVYDTREHHVDGGVYDTREHHVQGFNEDREECSSSDEGDISEAMTVNCSSGLDRRLFPVRLPRTPENTRYIIPPETSNVRELRLEALKHFQVALSSSPPLIAALLPYLQLLLSTGQVMEAWKMVEAFCRNSNHLLPFSLRARLAESLSSKQSQLLKRCYEEVLCKNPASVRSIKGLVNLHKKGDYQTESLLEYIALHLDATYGCTYIWRELASCFLKMQAKCQSEHEMDRISTQQNGNHSDARYKIFTYANQLPNMFQKAESRTTWKLRCRWWARRHFNTERIYLEQQENGDWEYMTFKAACACHILGPKFGYVSDIVRALQSVEKKDMLSVLKSHIQCSLRLHEHL